MTDRASAQAIARAVRGLVARHEWPVLDAIANGRLSVGDAFDAHRADELDAVPRGLNAVVRGEPVVGRVAWLKGRVVDTREVSHLATCPGTDCFRSRK